MMHSLAKSLTFVLQYYGASMTIQLYVYCQGELPKATMHAFIATEIHCQGVLGKRYVTLDTVATLQKLKWRRSLAFDGHGENWAEPQKLSMDETLECLEKVKDVSPGKSDGSKKRKRAQKDNEPKLFSRKSAL